MSEKKNFNDDKEFQSFSKNYIFESNKDINKTSQNEIVEFSFKKNLFISKADENNNSNHNLIPSLNEFGPTIYSKNDLNIQESGHFGKSKYDSKNYKEIIEKNSIKKQPLFYIEEKYNRLKEEEEEEEEEKNLKYKPSFKKENSNSCIFNDKIKKIQIIRKKKSIKSNNSINYKNNSKKIKNDSFILNGEHSYLYKKKFTKNYMNLINISNISNMRDNSFEGKINKSFYRINNTININEIQDYIINKKDEFSNLYRNTIQNKRLVDSNSTHINKQKFKTIVNHNSNYVLKNLKGNKENYSNNYGNIIFHNNNINNIIINSNNYCQNLDNLKYINYDPEKTYRNLHNKINKYSTIVNKNDKIDKIKNEFKKKSFKRNNNFIPSTSSFVGLNKRKNSKVEIEKKIKNMINISSGNGKLNTINNKSIGLYKTRTHRSKIENKKFRNYPNKKTPDKVSLLREKILNYIDKINN